MANKSQTITKLEFTHNPVPPGQGFAVKAHVLTGGPNRVHGDVEFFVDGKSSCTCRTDSHGGAIYEVPGGLLSAGDHEVTATFHGDGYSAESTSEPIVAVVNPTPGQPWPNDGPMPEPDAVSTPIETAPLAPAATPEPKAPGLFTPVAVPPTPAPQPENLPVS